ncbi:MAG: hypothetical protein ACM3SU_15680 [Acidobacteriota bacterium]
MSEEDEPSPLAGETEPGSATSPAPGAERSRPAENAAAPPGPRPGRAPRPELSESREPLYRLAGGFRLRLEPADLARLRELPGSRGRSDRELGEEFFEKQADRFAQSLAEDVTPPAEVRVVVDPYSRQAFLAIDRTIRSILSF